MVEVLIIRSADKYISRSYILYFILSICRSIDANDALKV